MRSGGIVWWQSGGGMPMTMAIVGGDARFALLAELLRAREWDVRVDPPAEQLR